MYVVMGANGHVGGAVAETLLDRGAAVTVVTHDPGGGERWRNRGAEVAVADANDPDSLRAAFRRGRRAFLLNPPADPATDIDQAERATVAGILAALEGSGLEKVVAQSTAGAQPGERIGDLSVLWGLEEGLRAQPIPAAINRAAYYMSNWDGLIGPARDSGKLPSVYPADMTLPMAAPADLGRVAAERLQSGLDDVGVRYVEGPERYSAAEVARIMSDLVRRPVVPEVIPPAGWRDYYLGIGFSPASADSFVRMAAATSDAVDITDDAIRGETTLGAYLRALPAG